MGITSAEVLRSNFDYLVAIDSEDELRALAPGFHRLRAIDTRGVTVTACSSSSNYDFVSRFFAPCAGIDEDPVTGSAHRMLGPCWAGRLGKQQMRALPASTRGGVLSVRLQDNEWVISGGQAITILSADPHE